MTYITTAQYTERRNGEFIIHEYADYLMLYKGNECIKFSQQHHMYIKDLIRDFYLYYNAVEARDEGEYSIVDYSIPALHNVRGFDLFPVSIPSFLENLNTTHQYIALAELNHDSIVLDLGSYCGLTAILMDMAIAQDMPSESRGGGNHC